MVLSVEEDGSKWDKDADNYADNADNDYPQAANPRPQWVVRQNKSVP